MDVKYEFTGKCDLTLMFQRLGLSGVEASSCKNMTIPSEEYPTLKVMSANCESAVAQCAVQMLALMTRNQATLGEMRPFMQLVTNGWQWSLVHCQFVNGAPVFKNSMPVSICALNDPVNDIITPLPDNDESYTLVSHMLAHILQASEKLAESSGRKLNVIEEHDHDHSHQEDEDDDDKDEDDSQKDSKGKSERKGEEKKNGMNPSGTNKSRNNKSSTNKSNNNNKSSTNNNKSSNNKSSNNKSNNNKPKGESAAAAADARVGKENSRDIPSYGIVTDKNLARAKRLYGSVDVMKFTFLR